MRGYARGVFFLCLLMSMCGVAGFGRAPNRSPQRVEARKIEPLHVAQREKTLKSLERGGLSRGQAERRLKEAEEKFSLHPQKQRLNEHVGVFVPPPKHPGKIDLQGGKDYLSLSHAFTLMSQKGELLQLGYDPGPIDSTEGPRTSEGVREFQSDHGLLPSGILDEATSTALRKSADIEWRQKTNFAEINRRRFTEQIITITYRPSNPAGRYALTTGLGSPVFATSDEARLAAEINQRLGVLGVSQLFLDLVSFPAEKADALTFSLRNLQREINDRISITGLIDGDPSGETAKLLFSEDFDVEETVWPAEEITQGLLGDWNGWLKLNFNLGVIGTLKLRLAKATLIIIARSRQIVAELVEILRAQISGAFRTNGPNTYRFNNRSSLERQLSSAKKEFMKRHPEIREDSFKLEIRSQLGAARLAELLGFEPVQA